MLLADVTNLEAIYSADILMLDGTFDYCPEEFYRRDYEDAKGEIKTTCGQVYTIHATYAGLPERQSNFLSGKF
jgi:hypothetical protein